MRELLRKHYYLKAGNEIWRSLQSIECLLTLNRYCGIPYHYTYCLVKELAKALFATVQRTVWRILSSIQA